jgi:phosphoenolpyruvate---glycerone phosphotransferase subunit DhaM
MAGGECVGLVLISHSLQIAEGLAELVLQVAGSEVPIAAFGGGPDGALGTNGDVVLGALRTAAAGSGAVVLMDLGSAVLAARSAVSELDDERSQRLIIADAPLVEGAIAAGVAASTGASLQEVARAAEEARHVPKL